MVSLPIGGFMPIPLAMMIPFMATQSIVMGDAFGKAYQFGKRKISAMSNEEFNRLTMADLISNMQQEFKASIPSIKQSIDDSSELQQYIVDALLAILPDIITQQAKGLTSDIQTVAGEAQEIATAGLTGLNTLLDKISGLIPNTPYAYGSNDTIIDQVPNNPSADTQAIIEANKPFTTNIPITLQSMTKKEISDAYSDMLSGRLRLSAKQKQELTLAFKQGKFVTSNLQIKTEILQPTKEQVEYQEWYVSWLTNYQSMIKVFSVIGHLTTSAKKLSHNAIQIKKYQRNRLTLLKMFGLARNSANYEIKIQARIRYANMGRNLPYVST